MTDEEKYNYILGISNVFLNRNEVQPYSELEKEAFYYKMLLLRGPASEESPEEGYKYLFLAWLVALGGEKFTLTEKQLINRIGQL